MEPFVRKLSLKNNAKPKKPNVLIFGFFVFIQIQLHISPIIIEIFTTKTLIFHIHPLQNTTDNLILSYL